jgi:outer membrane protein
MKKILQSLSLVAALGATALAAQAQSAPKILFVDMAKLYNGHYRTAEEKAKLQADSQKAQAEIDRMNKEGNALVAQYKELDEQSTNPTATSEAKAKAQSDAQAKLQEIRAKQVEIGKFHETAARDLQARDQQFMSMMMEEISKIASDIAKARGATALIDKSGPSLIGVPAVIYSDPSLDITDAVADEINKTRPIPPAATPAAAPAVPDASTPAPAAPEQPGKN